MVNAAPNSHLDLLTLDQVAAWLGVSRKTIDRYSKQGLQTFKFGNGKRRYTTPEYVESFRRFDAAAPASPAPTVSEDAIEAARRRLNALCSQV